MSAAAAAAAPSHAHSGNTASDPIYLLDEDDEMLWSIDISEDASHSSDQDASDADSYDNDGTEEEDNESERANASFAKQQEVIQQRGFAAASSTPAAAAAAASSSAASTPAASSSSAASTPAASSSSAASTPAASSSSAASTPAASTHALPPIRAAPSIRNETSAADLLRLSSDRRRRATPSDASKKRKQNPSDAVAAAAAAFPPDAADDLMHDDEAADLMNGEEERRPQHYNLYEHGRLLKKKKQKKSDKKDKKWKVGKSKKASVSSGDKDFDAAFSAYSKQYTASNAPYVVEKHSADAVLHSLKQVLAPSHASSLSNSSHGPSSAAAAASSSSSSASACPTDQEEFRRLACEDACSRSKLDPQPHQLRICRDVLEFSSQVGDWPTGSGKTLGACLSAVAIASYKMLVRGANDGNDAKCFFVVPKTLIVNMKRCLEQEYGGARWCVDRQALRVYDASGFLRPIQAC